MSKSLEIVNEVLEFQIVSTVKLLGNIDKKIFKLSLIDLDTIKQDLERLEEINKVWNDNEPMESVDINDEHLQELYDYINKLEKENEQLKQQRDSLAINNGELCVKVTDLQKENQELKEQLEIEKFDNFIVLGEKIDKYQKAIDILTEKRVNIDYLLNSSECPTYNFYADDFSDLTQQEYDLLKEVLE